MFFADRVAQYVSLDDDGHLELGEVKQAHRGFGEAFNDSDPVVYCLESSNGEDWEIGRGVIELSPTPRILRSSIRSSSNGGEAISLGPGDHTAFSTADASLLSPENNAYAASVLLTEAYSDGEIDLTVSTLSRLLGSMGFSLALGSESRPLLWRGSPSGDLPHTFSGVSGLSLSAEPRGSVSGGEGSAWRYLLRVSAESPSGDGEAYWRIDLDLTDVSTLSFRWKNPDDNNGDLYRVIKIGSDTIVEDKEGPSSFTQVDHDVSSLSGVYEFAFGFRLDDISFSSDYSMWLDDLRLVK